MERDKEIEGERWREWEWRREVEGGSGGGSGGGRVRSMNWITCLGPVRTRKRTWRGRFMKWLKGWL
jgi:hypothetical protein